MIREESMKVLCDQIKGICEKKSAPEIPFQAIERFIFEAINHEQYNLDLSNLTFTDFEVVPETFTYKRKRKKSYFGYSKIHNWKFEINTRAEELECSGNIQFEINHEDWERAEYNVQISSRFDVHVDKLDAHNKMVKITKLKKELQMLEAE